MRTPLRDEFSEIVHKIAMLDTGKTYTWEEMECHVSSASDWDHIKDDFQLHYKRAAWSPWYLLEVVGWVWDDDFFLWKFRGVDVFRQRAHISLIEARVHVERMIESQKQGVPEICPLN